MKCPRCGFDLVVKGRGRYSLVCPQCGWTLSPSRGKPVSEIEQEYGVSYVQWLVCWFLTLLVVLGPYVAILVLKPAWATDAFLWKYYWIGWGIYLLVAFVFSPAPKGDYPAWIFILFDEASWLDPTDYTLTWLGLLLAPGKIVIAALLGTPRHIWRLFSRGRKR